MKSEMPAHVKVGRLIRLFGWLTLILGFFLIVALIVPAATGQNGNQSMAAMLIPVFIIGGLGWLELYVGNAIKQHIEWARVAGIVLGALSLPGIPIGTIIGIYIIYTLSRKWDEKSTDEQEARRVLQVTAEETKRRDDIKSLLLPSERMCDACGTKYNPCDYNATSAEWLCSACKHPLNKF